MTDLTPEQEHLVRLLSTPWPSVVPRGVRAEFPTYRQWYATLNEAERGIMARTQPAGVIRVPFPSYAELARRKRGDRLRTKTLVRCHGPARIGQQLGVFSAAHATDSGWRFISSWAFLVALLITFYFIHI